MVNKVNASFKLTIEDAAQPLSYYDPALVNNSQLRLTPADKTVANDKVLHQRGKNALVIELPFTIEIEIKNFIKIDGNVANIKVYGLNETNRNKLFQNPWQIPILEDGTKGRRKVILEAGYGKNKTTIFEGTLLRGYSIREGVEWVTYLSCNSSAIGLYNTFINKSYSADPTQLEIVNDIITEMSQYEDIQKGAVTNTLADKKLGATSLLDQSYVVLSQFNVDIFVENGKINVLQTDEVLPNNASQATVNKQITDKLGLQIPNITADNGLIGTPILNEDGYVIVNMIFDPTIRIARLVNLESATASFFNGYYKVMGVEHKGVFSTSKEGSRTTTAWLWSGGSFVDNFRIVVS